MSATVIAVSGPVLTARSADVFHTGDAVHVGARGLLGEVIRIDGQDIVVQVYEDTSGLRPGDTVTGSGSALAVRLGPHLLGGTFDGLLRPLTGLDGDYVMPGSRQTPARRYAFEPRVAPGDVLTPGASFGEVRVAGGRTLGCLVPPGVHGQVERVAAAGEHADDAPLCTLRTAHVDAGGNAHSNAESTAGGASRSVSERSAGRSGDGADGAARATTVELAISHWWPVRTPRPVAARLPVAGPMLTGQRILDALFPVARGGKAALPGGFGTGKTVLQESIAKWCDADIIVYVGCGERGNEMAGVLHEFPHLEDPRSGRPLMERTVLIANVSNMPVAAREASMYSAISVAEYFRDQGLSVALMADSTSRWAEALREVSGRLGELPAEAGYPAYLSSRLAEFYERAARVRTLGGGEGAVTIIGAVSPPGGDFSEPVTTHTKRYVRCFWALDRARAHARFYPAIHPLQSYSEDVAALAPWWEGRGDPQWQASRRQFLTLLDQQARLERMSRIVGKDALPMRQQSILLCAQMVSEGFLRQSANSEVDRYCSPERQVRMMHLLVQFIALAEQAVDGGAQVDELAALPVVRALLRMGEEIPEGEPERFEALWERLRQEFAPWTRTHADAH